MGLEERFGRGCKGRGRAEAPKFGPGEGYCSALDQRGELSEVSNRYQVSKSVHSSAQEIPEKDYPGAESAQSRCCLIDNEYPLQLACYLCSDERTNKQTNMKVTLLKLREAGP